MTPGVLAVAVQDDLVALGGWTTAPAAVWFPDLKREDLKSGGLTAIVIVPESKQTKLARGDLLDRSPMVHVAVLAPIVTGSFAEGKAVVDKAIDVQDRLLGKRLTGAGSDWAICVSADSRPVISADMARENGLWVSYVILNFKAG
jgi:hypothetical protein